MVPIAYLGLVVIWSTVPLAIKWSLDGPQYLFGVSARFAIAALVLLAALRLTGRPWPRHATALKVYALATLNFYSFIGSYYAALRIPSGWIGVTWGAAPLLTAVLAAWWLGERSLTPRKVSGLLLGLAGFVVMFGTAAEFGPGAVLGLAANLTTVAVSTASTVWIKRIGAHIPALATTASGVTGAALAYGLTWALFDGTVPERFDPRMAHAIVYAALAGTAVVYMCFYYVLRHVSATRIALASMVTPALALYVGHVGDGEPIGPRVWIGTAMIMLALVLHEMVPRRAPARMAEPDLPRTD
ncbi:MAG: DMT family transporter [Gammaproteobacteria bacterium]